MKGNSLPVPCPARNPHRTSTPTVAHSKNRLSRKKVGKFLYLLSFSFLCIMEDTYLYHLASLVLPKDVLKYFSVVKIEPSPSLLRIHLDEKMEKELSDDLHFESKGFMDAVEVTDFPIRDHKVILVLRRRRWLDTRTGKSFSLPLLYRLILQPPVLVIPKSSELF